MAYWCSYANVCAVERYRIHSYYSEDQGNVGLYKAVFSSIYDANKFFSPVLSENGHMFWVYINSKFQMDALQSKGLLIVFGIVYSTVEGNRSKSVKCFRVQLVQSLFSVFRLTIHQGYRWECLPRCPEKGGGGGGGGKLPHEKVGDFSSYRLAVKIAGSRTSGGGKLPHEKVGDFSSYRLAVKIAGSRTSDINVDTVPFRGSGVSEVKFRDKIKPLLRKVRFRFPLLS